MDDVIYKAGLIPSVEQVIKLYVSSGIKRPVKDKSRIEAMYQNSNLIISAWHDDSLVGVARSLTDYHYSCYLSDLAVLKDWQGRGVGKMLLANTKKSIGDSCSLVLLASKTAMSYYEHISLKKIINGFIIDRLD